MHTGRTLIDWLMYDDYACPVGNQSKIAKNIVYLTLEITV